MNDNIKSLPWTLSDGVLSVKLDLGFTVSLDETHPNFAAALSALRSKEFDLIPNLVNISHCITKLGAGIVTVCGGEVFYRGNPIANSLTDRILTMLREGNETIAPMVNFLENCMLNPNKDAQARLFTFLEKSKLPLTPDGCFLAYRGVNEDFTDKHSGQFNNSPGQIVKMDRKGCDEDSHSCCSRGLHFCSLPYLGPTGGWAGGRDNIIVVKINPRDVVAIPYSYDDTKGRCCRFEVLRTWQSADDAKDLTQDAWSVSLVAETEEVTSPAIRAMLNLARIEEALEGFELRPIAEIQREEMEAMLASYNENEAGEGEDSDEDYCEDCGEPTDYCECIAEDDNLEDDQEGENPLAEEPPTDSPLADLLPEMIDTTIILNGPIPKSIEDRKTLIADLYKLALRADEPAFAYKFGSRKTTGDIKVTPQGRVLTFDANTFRWVAWYDIGLSK